MLKRYWIWLFLLLALGYLAVYLSQNVARLDAVLTPRWHWLGAALLAHLGYWLVVVRSWSRIVEAIAGVATSFGDGFTQLVFVNVGKYLPGKVWGMVARGGRMAQRRVGAAAAVNCTLVEQILLLHSAAAVVLLCTVVLRPAPWAWALLVCVLLALAVSDGVQRLLFAATDALARRLRRGAVAGAGTRLLCRGAYAGLTARYLLVWIALGVTFGCVSFALMDVDATVPNLAWLVLANTVGFVLGFAAVFAPGGIGVREAAAGVTLLPIMSVEQAAFATLVFRLWIVASELLTAALSAVLIWRERRELRQEPP